MKSQNSSTKFAGCGIKNTVQRKLVFAILEGENRPLTADEIYVKLKEKKETISLSTIYRILEVFAEKGLILKTSIFNEKKFTFEINRLEHKHYLNNPVSMATTEADKLLLIKILGNYIGVG